MSMGGAKYNSAKSGRDKVEGSLSQAERGISQAQITAHTHAPPTRPSISVVIALTPG